MSTISVDLNFAGRLVMVDGVLFLCQKSQTAFRNVNGVSFLPDVIEEKSGR